MNRVLSIIILIFCSLAVAAQSQVYKLHPALGDTIDKDEIQKYDLFTDYVGDSIDYLIVHKNNDLFSLEGLLKNTCVLNIQVNKAEILLQEEHVEKLNNYYISVLKKDSSIRNEDKNRALISDPTSIKNVDLNIMTPEYIKSLKKTFGESIGRRNEMKQRLIRKKVCFIERRYNGLASKTRVTSSFCLIGFLSKTRHPNTREC